MHSYLHTRYIHVWEQHGPLVCLLVLLPHYSHLTSIQNSTVKPVPVHTVYDLYSQWGKSTGILHPAGHGSRTRSKQGSNNKKSYSTLPVWRVYVDYVGTYILYKGTRYQVPGTSAVPGTRNLAAEDGVDVVLRNHA